ncbi:8-amino-7-oxononanoate synthase [Vibrio ponticus]
MTYFMTQAFNQRIADSLALRKQQGLNRQIAPVALGNHPVLSYQHAEYSNFSSNDYLGLAGDKELAKAWQQGIDRYGNGSGASPLVTGFSHAHQLLEEKLCQWLGYSRAILFSSGFSANQAMLFSLLEKGDLLLQDKLNHASLMEAGMLSPATMKRFQHNDVSSLTKLLQSNTLVVTEGVFSMDGDTAPLAQIDQAIEGKAWLAVDDAHGIGVLGHQGRGSCDAAGIKPQLLVVTFGKAFGLSGAAIMCDQAIGDYLTQFARHHVYSTAMPPSQAHALSHAVDMITMQQWRRDKLSELYYHYDKALQDVTGYQYTETPIKPFIVGQSDKAVLLSQQLKSRGQWLTAIRPPTVAKGKARLRITLTANHSVNQITHLADELKALIEG